MSNFDLAFTTCELKRLSKIFPDESLALLYKDFHRENLVVTIKHHGREQWLSYVNMSLTNVAMPL